MARSSFIEIRSKRMSRGKWALFPPAVAGLSGANAWLQYWLYPGQSQALFVFPVILTILCLWCTYQSGSKGERARNSAYLGDCLAILVMIGSCAFTWDAQRQISSGREMADELAKGAETNQGFVKGANETRLAELTAYTGQLNAYNNCVAAFNRLPSYSREKLRGMTVEKKCDWMKPKEVDAAPAFDPTKLDLDPNAGRREVQKYISETNRYFLIFQVGEMGILFVAIMLSYFFEQKTARRRKMPTRTFRHQIVSTPSPARSDDSDLIQ